MNQPRVEAAYSKIKRDFWTNRKVRRMSVEARLLYIYLISCKDNPGTGIFQTYLSVVAAEVGLTIKQVETALVELGETNTALYDEDSLTMYLPKYMEHNRPDSSKSAIGGMRHFHAILESPFVEDFVKNFVASLSESTDKKIVLSKVRSVLSAAGLKFGWIDGASDRASHGTSHGTSDGASGTRNKQEIGLSELKTNLISHELEHEHKHENENEISARAGGRACARTRVDTTETHGGKSADSFDSKKITNLERTCATKMGFGLMAIVEKPREYEAIKKLIAIGANDDDFEEARCKLVERNINPPFWAKQFVPIVEAIAETRLAGKREIEEKRAETHKRLKKEWLEMEESLRNGTCDGKMKEMAIERSKAYRARFKKDYERMISEGVSFAIL